MTGAMEMQGYGTLPEPAKLKIQRLLPGSIERVWSYLTESDLRRKWLASGAMEQAPGTAVEFIWRNDELTTPPGERPTGFSEEGRMQSRITEVDPPRKLAFTWGESGSVVFELERRGTDTMLTLTHDRLGERKTKLMIAAGWHAHLDILAARLGGETPEPFWDHWSRLHEEYDRRMPA